MTKTPHIVISTEKHLSHPYALYPYFLKQITGPNARCVTHSTVVTSLRNAEILSQLNILGKPWRSWFELERLFKPDTLSCLPFWVNQEKLGLKSEIQVIIFSLISLLQNFCLQEHQCSERQSVHIIHARFKYRPARSMFSIRDFVIKDFFLCGVSYLWNRTASLWQYVRE